jgi:hypothetical protein
MTPEKKAARKTRNLGLKAKKAEVHRQFLVHLGHVVVEKEVPVVKDGAPVLDETGKQVTKKVLDFPPFIKTSADGTPLPFRGQFNSPHRLGWIAGRCRATRFGDRKGQSSHLLEYNEAIGEHGSRVFAAEVEKILNPPVESPTATVTPEQVEAITKQLEKAGLSVKPVGMVPEQ